MRLVLFLDLFYDDGRDALENIVRDGGFLGRFAHGEVGVQDGRSGYFGCSNVKNVRLGCSSGMDAVLDERRQRAG